MFKCMFYKLGIVKMPDATIGSWWEDTDSDDPFKKHLVKITDTEKNWVKYDMYTLKKVDDNKWKYEKSMFTGITMENVPFFGMYISHTKIDTENG